MLQLEIPYKEIHHGGIQDECFILEIPETDPVLSGEGMIIGNMDMNMREVSHNDPAGYIIEIVFQPGCEGDIHTP